ncbi:protein DOG1-like 4 [Chenopodium quinoa]|uniref:DOG1 domain-containing protein n=1 Tax=Chenopodium quinoa TaxID=63459 RepID=A0A803ME02_CHEQI|nr:protein DOG1-like 4 [Chenopodium quinoa]
MNTNLILPLKYPAAISTTSIVEEKFCAYYESWLKQLEIHLQQLVLGRHPNYDVVVATLITHHKEFYAAKWAAARDDVLSFFSPQWASPLEAAFTWVTGWKPSTAFRLVESLRKTRAPLTSLSLLTDEQASSVAALGTRIKHEEQKVEMDLERLQMAICDLKMVGLAKMSSRKDFNESSRVEDMVSVAMKGLMDGMEKVLKMADYVRLKTLKGILDVLTPRQRVDFLAVFAMLQIQIRKWGKQKAANDTANNKTTNDTTSNDTPTATPTTANNNGDTTNTIDNIENVNLIALV